MKKEYKKRISDEEIIKLIESGLKIRQIMLTGASFYKIKEVIYKNNLNYVKGKPGRRKKTQNNIIFVS